MGMYTYGNNLLCWKNWQEEEQQQQQQKEEQQQQK